MAKDRARTVETTEQVISIIGPGMRIIGDVRTEGSVRVEGVVEGSLQAGKGIVLGGNGRIVGDVRTQDAILSGHLDGTIVAESRLEIQSQARVDGEIRALRLQLEEGAVVNGNIHMGEDAIRLPETPGSGGSPRSEPAPDED